MSILTLKKIGEERLLQLLDTINQYRLNRIKPDNVLRAMFTNLTLGISPQKKSIAELLNVALDYSDNKLFAYGTLQPGEANHNVLAAIEGKWKRGFVRGDRIESGWGISYGHSALVWNPKGSRINGSLLTAEKINWTFLDDLEGIEYQRILIPVYDDTGILAIANVYSSR